MVYSFTRTHTLHVNDTNIYTYLELLHVIRTGYNISPFLRMSTEFTYKIIIQDSKIQLNVPESLNQSEPRPSRLSVIN